MITLTFYRVIHPILGILEIQQHMVSWGKEEEEKAKMKERKKKMDEGAV